MKTERPKQNHIIEEDNQSQELGTSISPPAFQLKADPIQMKPVYRGMTEDGGKPALGESARKLGVRKGTDITIDEKDNAVHDKKGMSTSPGDPKNLPLHRRPPEFGGTGKDPVWEADSGSLSNDKIEWFEDDPGKHGIVRPKKDMPYSEFKKSLEGTQGSWKKKSASGKSEEQKEN